MKDLNTQELLDLLEKAVEEKKSSSALVGITKEKKSVHNFIKGYGVETGLVRVPTYIIYYTYRLIWTGETVQNKTNLISFFRTFSKYFTSVRTGQVRSYLLEGSKFDLSREGKIKAKSYAEIQRKKRKTWKESKQKKISKSRKIRESQRS